MGISLLRVSKGIHSSDEGVENRVDVSKKRKKKVFEAVILSAVKAPEDMVASGLPCQHYILLWVWMESYQSWKKLQTFAF